MVGHMKALPDSFPTCTKCNQALKNPEHQKCMYCGEPIPEELRLTKEEVHSRLSSKHEKWKEEQKKSNQWGSFPKPKRSNVGWSIETDWFSIGGESDDDDWDGDA